MEAVALTEAGIAAWLWVFAGVAGWAMLDPLMARLPLFLRLMVAAVLAAALLPGVSTGYQVSPFSVAGGLALSLQWLLGALLALCVRIISRSAPARLVVLAFLAANGHLLVVDALMQSISHASVAALPSADGARQLIEGAGWIFAAGIQLALPLLVFALLLHLSLAIIARTQPGVDMFSTGLALGALGMLVALAWAAPLIAVGIQQGLVQMQPWLIWGSGR